MITTELKVNYRRDIEFGEKLMRKRVREILKDLETQQTPYAVKEELIALNQLYLDGLIAGRAASPWQNQEEGLVKLAEAGALAVGSFYEGTMDVNIERIRETVIQMSDLITLNASGSSAKNKHLYRREEYVAEWGTNVQKEPALESVEVIVPVASDGFEPAFLASHFTGARVLPLRYSRYGQEDKETRVPLYAPLRWAENSLARKNVLVTEGDSERGFSLRKVVDYVMSAGAASITFTSVLPERLSTLPYLQDMPHTELSGNLWLTYPEGVGK